jgi:tRNA (cytidine/uridine-2'-O-)-methyltransferase
VHPSLDAFLAAFPAARCWWIETSGALPYASAPFAHGDALVFGPETGTVPHRVLDAHPGRTLRIPMRAGAVRSLNLSTAAGIVTYAALAALGFPELT